MNSISSTSVSHTRTALEIFNYPELRLATFRCLDSKTLKACTLVCKAWYEECQPFVWRGIRHLPHWEAANPATLDAWEDSFRKHARWVKHAGFVANMKAHELLISIVSEHCRSLASIDTSVSSKAEMDVWISVIKLNPGLQRAKFQNVNSHKDILDESRMLDALKGLRRLQHIHLPAAPSVAYLRRILDICPSLQELSVQILLASGQTEWPNDYRDKPAMMTTYSLRKLALVYCFHNPPVTELLSCFPVLEGLELGQVGIECRQGLIVVFKEGGLPLLSSITMREYDDYTELMDAIPVQQLRMVRLVTNSTSTLNSLLERQGPSLEVLMLDEFCDSTEFGKVFFECPRLRKLESRHSQGGSIFVDVRCLLYRPWVCMDLEKLVVTIGVSHMFSSLLPPVLADAIAENRDGPTRMSNCQLAEKLFAERFRNLKKLRDVRITTRNRAGRLSYGDCDSESELDTDELGFPTYDMTPAGVMRWRFH